MTQFDLATRTDAIWPGFTRGEAKAIRLVLIDDHPVVREGICALLSLEGDMRVVGDAGDLDSGIELARRLEPDLVICDLTMPGCTGALSVRTLCRECPTIRVLVLSAHDSLECIRESFAAGAIGYVRKDALRADLLAALRRAAAGARAMCLGVSDLVMRNWLLDAASAPRYAGSGPPYAGLRPPHAGSAPPDEVAPLEPADRQILRLIALGVPTWRIAADLRRGVKVVEKYRANLMRRLNLSSTAAVARYAVSCNLLSREEVDRLVSAE